MLKVNDSIQELGRPKEETEKGATHVVMLNDETQRFFFRSVEHFSFRSDFQNSNRIYATSLP